MGLKSQGGPRDGSKEYGRKSYVPDKEQEYIALMRRVTDAAIYEQAMEKHSEFKKPYLEDSYEEMETYHLPKLPVLTWDPWEGGSDRTHFVGPAPDDPNWVFGRGCIITCKSPLDCKDEVTCYPSIFQGEKGAIKYTVFVNGKQHGGWYIKGSDNIYPLHITSPELCWNGDPFSKTRDVVKVRMVDQADNFCETIEKVFCRECSCCDSDSYVALTIDEANTDDTINNATPATVTIQDGCAPYNWSVSGLGYSITPSGSSDSKTATVSVVSGTCNTHYAANCTVTITDCEGAHSTTKIIRNTGGTWKYKCTPGSTCPDAGPCYGCSLTGVPITPQEFIVDDRKYEFAATGSYFVGSGYSTCTYDTSCLVGGSPYTVIPITSPCSNAKSCGEYIGLGTASVLYCSTTDGCTNCYTGPSCTRNSKTGDVYADFRYHKWECP